MIFLPRVLEAAGEVERFCQQRGWKFCLIGGVAVQRWGEPRFTQDVGLTLLTGIGGERSYIDAVLAVFEPRRADAHAFALQNRVLLVRTATGVDVDIALGAVPFEERAVERASKWVWSTGQTLTTCSADDLIVFKTFAGRDVDWGDVERILTRQHRRLNLPQIRSELAPLLELKGEPEALTKLEGKIAAVERRLRT